MLELSVCSDIAITVHQVITRNSHIMELKSRVVDTIQADLVTHIMNLNVGIWNQVWVSDWNQKSVDAFVFAIDDSLCKNQSLVGVYSPICYPIFLRLDSWWVNNKLFPLMVIGSSCFHHDSVIAITQFSQAKTSSDRQVINQIKDLFVSFCMQGHNTSTCIIILKYRKDCSELWTLLQCFHQPCRSFHGQ